MLIDFLLRFYLYWVGIKFYETTAIPLTAEFMKVEMITTGNHEMIFTIYRDTCCDHVYRRGRVIKREYMGYMIQGRFGKGLPVSVYSFNNLKLFFSHPYLQKFTERVVSKYLLQIYLSFIQKSQSE